jgi:Leucine-rich repeat (LRR) protein
MSDHKKNESKLKSGQVSHKLRKPVKIALAFVVGIVMVCGCIIASLSLNSSNDPTVLTLTNPSGSQSKISDPPSASSNSEHDSSVPPHPETEFDTSNPPHTAPFNPADPDPASFAPNPPTILDKADTPRYDAQGITDEILASMVSTGSIPQSVDSLVLSSNQISDISPLSSLTELNALSLSNNKISNLSQLQPLVKLSYLDLKDNSISDLSPMRPLTELTYLELKDNNISDLTALKPLRGLTHLNLTNNNISDIAPLKSLVNLKTLQLSGNPDISETELKKLQAALPNCVILYW